MKTIYILLYAFSCIYLACNSATAESSNAAPLAVLSGGDSNIAEPQCLRITSDLAWAELWSRHLGTRVDDHYRARFEVDFSRCTVVAILLGDSINTCGIEIHRVAEVHDSVTVRFDTLKYQTAGQDNHRPPDTPYAFVILPRTEKNIVVVRGVREYTGPPTAWKVQAILKPESKSASSAASLNPNP